MTGDLGLIDIAAGVVAIVRPGPTALVLVIVVAIWVVIGGIAEFASPSHSPRGRPRAPAPCSCSGGIQLRSAGKDERELLHSAA